MEHVTIKLFNRTKYENNLNKLKARKAPNYVIEAYNRGYIKIINEYYRQRLNSKRGLNESFTKEEIKTLEDFVKNSNMRMLEEAFNKKDLDFLNLMYQMTNIDILTKHRKIPANAGKLIKQGEILDLGLTKLHKRLK